MLRDLPDGDIAIAGARLVLVDIFEIDVEAGAGSARRKLCNPVRINITESGAGRLAKASVVRHAAASDATGVRA